MERDWTGLSGRGGTTPPGGSPGRRPPPLSTTPQISPRATRVLTTPSSPLGSPTALSGGGVFSLGGDRATPDWADVLGEIFSVVGALRSRLCLPVEFFPAARMLLPHAPTLVVQAGAGEGGKLRTMMAAAALLGELKEGLRAGAMAHAHCGATCGVLSARLAALRILQRRLSAKQTDMCAKAKEAGEPLSEERQRVLDEVSALRRSVSFAVSEFSRARRSARQRQLRHAMRVLEVANNQRAVPEEMLLRGCGTLSRSPLSGGGVFSGGWDGQQPVEDRRARAGSPPAAASTREGRWWRLGPFLGRGGFGVVHLGQNERTGELLAVKTVAFDPHDAKVRHRIRFLQAEISLMRRLRHPLIVRYLGTAREGNKVHVVMEYVPGGSISQLLRDFGAFGEPAAASYMRDVLEGLYYLQSNGVVHGDIKGANILIDARGRAKLADFGAAAATEVREQLEREREAGIAGDEDTGRSPPADATPRALGTLPWMAPEVLRTGRCTCRSDMWSVGATLLEMLTGRVPFSQALPSSSAVAMMLMGDKAVPLPDGLPTWPNELMLWCLQRDPLQRPTITELSAHAWLSQEPEVRQTDDELVESSANLFREIQSRSPATQLRLRTLLSSFLLGEGEAPTEEGEGSTSHRAGEV